METVPVCCLFTSQFGRRQATLEPRGTQRMWLGEHDKSDRRLVFIDNRVWKFRAVQ